MFSKEDRQYLNQQAYSMALEKFFSRELETHYYSDQNDKNRIEKNIKMNFAIEKVYPYSNEDLLSTFKHLDLEDKTIACTGSGGDEILMAIAMGAKKIIHVDGNLFAKPFIEYKLTAMQVLSHEEFTKYFLDSQDYFNREVFERVFIHLNAESKAFWGTIYSSGISPREIHTRMMQPGKTGYEESTKLLRNKEYYEFLQDRLKEKDYELRFETAEFSDFPEAIGEKCDVVMLSNIQQYVNDEDYINTVNTLYENHLKPGGKIQLSYTFSKANWDRPAIDLTPRFLNFFEDKQEQISMVELENKDKTFFLEKPKEKELDKDE